MSDAESTDFGPMDVAKSPERLPLGWTEKIGSKEGEEVKYYYNVITRQKFYSKEDLSRYVELGSPSQGTRQRTRALNSGNPENLKMLGPAVTHNTPEWLPQGWIVELNATSTGRKYKTYFDPSTGRKFYSKPEIVRYLNSDECTDSTAKQFAMSIVSACNFQDKSCWLEENYPEWLPQGWIMQLNIGSTGRKVKHYIDPSTGQKCYSKPQVMTYLKKSNNRKRYIDPSTGQKCYSKPQVMNLNKIDDPKIEVVKYEAERLPPGWIKEIKFQRIGDKIRKDPFYTDPDSKYVFRSVLDALRYLENKDISACVMKPRKREELEFLTDDVSLNILEEKQILLLDNSNMIEECIEKVENHTPTSGQLQSTPVSKRKRGRPKRIWEHEKPDEIFMDSTRSDGVQVITEEADATEKPDEIIFNSTRSDSVPVTTEETEATENKPDEIMINSTRSDGVQAITEEAEVTNKVVKVEEENVEPKQVFGGDSCVYPRLEFAFKTLRGDIPVEANNLAAQGYDHHRRASVSVGLPSFSDYARRRI